MFRKKRTLWIALIVLILAVVGGYYYYGNVYLKAQAAEEPSIQTTRVRRGDLVISATGAGTVIPPTEINLGFQGSGILAELNVQVGDRVQTGDVLARLDTTDAQETVADADLQVAKAQLDLATAQSDYDELLKAASEADMLDGEASVKSAEENLAQVKAGPTKAEIGAAEAALLSAQESYERVVNGPTSQELREADLKLSQAKNNLWSAQASRDSTCGRGNGAECDGANARVANAELDVETVQMDLEELKEPATRAEIQDALSKVTQAQEVLDELREGPSDAEIVAAEAQLAVAQERLADLVEGPSAREIANSEAQVEKARLSLVRAELSLESAKRALIEKVLIAPMDGTVMSVAAQVGESVGSAALIPLADLSQPLIEIYLDETDLGMIGVGYEVEVVLDALPDETFIGHVVQVDPSLVREENVDAVRALVRLDEASFAKPQAMPVGLNAAVEVIGGRAEGALLVPVEALRELGPGEYAVFVMEDGEPKLRVVEVGLMDYTYAEIRSGLELGDEVTTGIVETR